MNMMLQQRTAKAKHISTEGRARFDHSISHWDCPFNELRRADTESGTL